MDVRTMLLLGKTEEAVEKFGRDTVLTEIDEMIFHDLADKAFSAAVTLGDGNLAKTAAQVVINSGSYGNKARGGAFKYLMERAGAVVEEG